MAQWKHGERRVAKYIDGERISRGANFGQSLGDIEHDWLSVEVKYRREIPSYLREWLNQAKGYDELKLPLVVLLEKGKHIGNGIVFMRLEDFRDHFGGFDGKKKVST